MTEGHALLVLGGAVEHQAKKREDGADVAQTIEEAQHQGQQKEPAVSPEDLVGNVVIVQRDEGCPARLSCLGVDAPLCYDDQKPERDAEEKCQQDEQRIARGCHDRGAADQKGIQHADEKDIHKNLPPFDLCFLEYTSRQQEGQCRDL